MNYRELLEIAKKYPNCCKDSCSNGLYKISKNNNYQTEEERSPIDNYTDKIK
jgi:hypothetical protein